MMPKKPSSECTTSHQGGKHAGQGHKEHLQPSKKPKDDVLASLPCDDGTLPKRFETIQTDQFLREGNEMATLKAGG